MPFTLSHAAIVLPIQKLSKSYFSLTGLIIGSMAPDLEYFSRMKILATYGHLWLDGLWFNMIIALIYCFLFHLLVKDVLIYNLPSKLQARCITWTKFCWIADFKKNWLIVLGSIIIGIYSHLFWDAFTHEWGFFAKQISILQKTWLSFPIEIKGYKILQYFSSIIGLMYVIYEVFKLPKSAEKINDFSFSFWIKITAITLLISFIRFYFFPIEIMTGNIIVVPMMAFFISLMLFGMIEKFKNKKPQV